MEAAPLPSALAPTSIGGVVASARLRSRMLIVSVMFLVSGATGLTLRIRGTDEFRHTVSGFDFQMKVAGRGPLLLQDVGRKVYALNPETGEEEVVFRAGHTTLPEGLEVDAVLCAAVS